MTAERLSLVTNASANDLDRLRLVVPHWLSVFGSRLGELVIVLDEQPPTGRIAMLHARNDDQPFSVRLADVRHCIEKMSQEDRRIILRQMPEGREHADLVGRWFGDFPYY